jgi:hypothetical protein
MTKQSLYVVWTQAEELTDDGQSTLIGPSTEHLPGYTSREEAEAKAASLRRAGVFATVEAREVELAWRVARDAEVKHETIQ